MKATNWEFKNRAMIFGLIFGVSFLLYAVDHQTSTAVLANWLEPRLHVNADTIARLLFAIGALFLALGALIRTWASSFLHADIVYASQVKSASLVADGPYRRVRNPLYFANVLLAIGLGSMMSRSGFALVIVLMVVFCYRLILREESELRAAQGASFDAYCKAVPRLFFSPSPRIPSSGRAANWSAGFKAEAWCWGFAAGSIAFAITLKVPFFFGILAASLAIFWLSSYLLEKRPGSQA
jgi:protein-S-isoprenylcysteine O-methyltransferase Ste14